MLAPDSRTLLLDALRPPVGSRLDYAVATTFTLDLTTALMAPLALAGFNLSGAADLTAVTEALTRSAEHLDVFAQAGMLRADSWPGDLTALLEGSVHTVRRPRPGHLFHPKLWVLRFVEDDEYSYRCIVTSRNLTADRSWDVILRLDSDPETSKVHADNDGLRRLLEALPSLTTHPLAEQRRERLASLTDDLRRVWWQMPEGIDNVRFLAFGVDKGVRKSELGELFRGYRHLVVSPFVTETGLQTLLGDSIETELTVVSRAEELDALQPGALADTTVFTLHPDAGLGDRESDEPISTENMLGGLHAKVYVIEAQKRSFVYVGSPNATDAAFSGNVEVLCELAGPAKSVGVSTMVGDGAAFRDVLRAYTPPAEPTVDKTGDAARRLESWLVDVAEMRFVVSAEPKDGKWMAVLRSETALPALPDATVAEVTLAPFNSRAESILAEPGQPVHHEFVPRESVDLTPFFVLTVTARSGGSQVTRSTVLVARLVGAPSTRLDDVLLRQLDTREKFIQFLMLVLAMDGDAPTGIDASLTGRGSWSAQSLDGLLELLIRSLAVNPEALDRVVGLIDRLDVSSSGQSVLPPGWSGVWPAIRRARELVGREAS